MRICLIRQRPSIGDCLLLAPLIREIQAKYKPKSLTVITDPEYMSGALVDTFRGIEGIDQIEQIPSLEWTTDGNIRIDARLMGACPVRPDSVKKADLLFDCNSAFIEYERSLNGQVTLGIAEFWLRHFKLYKEGVGLLPCYKVTDEVQEAARDWLFTRYGYSREKPTLGIVLRSGAPARDWDSSGLPDKVGVWAVSRGYNVVGIDSIRTLKVPAAFSCTGRRLPFVAAVLSLCTAVLTPDTGLLHLAQAMGTPQIALWGIVDPMLRLNGYSARLVPQVSHGFCEPDDKTCACPWKFQRWSCLRRLKLQEICGAVESVVEALR